MSARARGTRRRVIQVALCILMALSWVLARPAIGENPVLQPEFVAKLSRYPTDIARKYKITDFPNQVDPQAPQGSLISNPALDVVYQLWTITNHPTLSDHTVIAERSLEDLRLRRSIVIPRVIIRSNSSIGVEFVHTLDTRNQRMFLEFGHYALTPDPSGLAVLDLKKFTFIEKEYPRVVRVVEKFQAVFGLEYDEEADQLIVLAAGIDNNPSSAGNTLSLLGWKKTEFDTAGALPGPPSMLGPRYVRNCRRDPINTVSSPRLTPIMIAKGPDLDSSALNPPVKTWIVFPCFSTAYSVNDVLIRISREGLFDPTAREEKAIPAPASIAHWSMDTKRGRMFLLNATQEVDAWVYEVASNAFIGLIEMSPKGDTSAASVALGVDEESGRLYGVGYGFGIMITEADQDPVPQADTYEIGAPRLASQAPIAVDPKRDRIIFLRGAGGPFTWVNDYELWRVPPPLPPQEQLDRDLLTSQVAEAPGQTTAEFGGIASAYGARFLLAGGIGGAVPSNGNDQTGSLYANANARCGFRNREIGLGVVPVTELSESIVNARAESIRLDDNSVKDFGQPSRCEGYYQYAGPVPQIFPQVLRDNLFFASMFGKLESIRQTTGLDKQLEALGVAKAIKDLTKIDTSRSSEQHFNDATAPHTRWDYHPAFCAADYYPNDKPGQNSERFAGDTRVGCRKPGEVEAQAEGHATGVLGEPGSGLAFRIGRATSSTRVRLDPKDGLVSEATARLENVQIGPVTIGFIENTARSIAHGRTASARTDEFEPKIGLVRGGGITGCEIRCSLDELLPQLNNALAGRAEVRRTKPDLRLQKGTPGGFEAGIIKSDKQQASDNALTGDSSREVAALEVLVYNDNPMIGSARQLVQFAGVRATSNYGIKVIDAGTPCPDCEPAPFIPPPPPPEGPQIITIEKQGPVRTIIRRVPVVVSGPSGYKLLMANPRAAGAMATVWMLLLAPAVAFFRRRRLKTLQ
jgi:hypothetical protein